jgi:ATP-dependent Clp protease protease subunit
MSEKIKSSLEVFHENDVYIERRTIPIIGEIDISMFEKVFKNLHVLDAGYKTINLVINSSGGDVLQARAICDAIEGCVNEVHALVYGEASSAASLILQSADKRYITPNSKIMVHVGSETLALDHPRNIDAQYKDLREDERWLEDVYLKRIKEKRKRFTRHQLKSLLQYDRYLSPKEALDLNLIDEIRKSL